MNQEIEQMESSQRQHHEVMLHQKKIGDIAEITVYQKMIALGISPVKDGDQWCVLYGDNLQEGVAAFGDTMEEAIIRWGHNMQYEKLTPPKER